MKEFERNIENNNVNDALRKRLESVAFGRRGRRASSVVNKRKPCSADIDGKPIKIGTWNVRIMLRPGKLANVVQEMRRGRINILGLAEVRWKDGGDFVSELVRVVYAGGKESQRGVALLLDESVAKCVISTETHGDRVIMVKIQAQPANLVVIQVYMPTSVHSEEDVDEVYNKLEELIKKVKGTDYLVIMGDWNAVVGEGKEEKCVGEFGLGQKNERGQRLIEFCNQQQLMVTNTWFKQDKRRRYTWKAPGDTNRYQLDYILVKQRYANSVKNSNTYPEADADTDHNLVMMTAFLALKNVRCKKTRKQWDREKISTCREELAEAVDKRLKSGRNATVNMRWENLKNTVYTQAKG